MDEAETYQQRLQAIAEKRRMQEEAEKVRRGMEEESLKHAQHKRKTLREQWLMDRPPVTSSNPEDPKLQSIVPAFHTTEQSAKEAQRLERQMKKEEVEKSENIKEESSQIRKDEPTIRAADNKEKLTQAYLEEEERNVLEALDVNVKRNLASEAAQEDTEEQNKPMTEKQEVRQSAVDAVKFVDLSQHSLQQIKTPEEANLSLVDDEEWEIVNCSSEEAMDLVLTSDLTQDQSDSCLENKRVGAVLEVEHIFIMDKEDDLEVGVSDVLSLGVAKRKSDLENTSCEKPHEGALQTLCLEKGAHLGTSAHLQELDNVPGTVYEESYVFSVDRRQNLQSLPAHATCARKEILGDNTKNEADQTISASTNVKVEWEKASGLEDDVRHHIPLEKKREQPPSLLQRKIVAQSSESEIQILSLPSGTLNGAETVISNKRKTCHCCIVM